VGDWLPLCWCLLVLHKGCLCNWLSVQKAGLEMLTPCTGEPLSMWSQVEQHLLCLAALESIHSLLEAREEKRGKKREKLRVGPRET
jgi:uncharacterized membrane protein YuzA (DUF378 family)